MLSLLRLSLVSSYLSDEGLDKTERCVELCFIELGVSCLFVVFLGQAVLNIDYSLRTLSYYRRKKLVICVVI